MLKNKKIYEEKIQQNIGLIENGHVFDNFKEILAFFGIEKELSSNSRKAFYKTLERYLTYKNIEKSQKIIILEVFNHKKPDIKDKSLENSPLYLPCFYLFLKYLAIKRENHQDKEYYYLSKTKVSEIIGLCNQDYYNNKNEYLEKTTVKQCFIFIYL